MSKAVLVIIIVILIIVVGWVFWMLWGGSFVGQSGPRTFMIEGMKVEIERAGSGKGAKEGDLLTVNYIASLSSGKKVDSSYDRNRSFVFKLGEGKVIRAWELGLVGMKVGEKRRLTSPPELAYGESPNGEIPANSTLVFEVELLRISN